MHAMGWVRGAAVAVAGLGALVMSGTAWGDSGAALQAGQAPTTAAGFAPHVCDVGGGPYAGQDVWAFALPDSTRQFVSVTAGFDTNGDSVADTTLTAPAAGGINGNSAWILAPGAAVLLDANATVTGTAGSVIFHLSRTCPAGVAASPSPKVSKPPVKASPRPATRARHRTAAVPSQRATQAPSPSESASPWIVDEPAEPGGSGPNAISASEPSRSGAGSKVLTTGAILAFIVYLVTLRKMRRRRRPGGRHRMSAKRQ
jgi:hypothetical protein